MTADNEGDVNNDGAAVEEEVGGLEEDVVVVAKSGVLLAEDVGGDTTRVGVAAKVPSVGSPRVDMGGGGKAAGGELCPLSLQNWTGFAVSRWGASG